MTPALEAHFRLLAILPVRTIARVNVYPDGNTTAKPSEEVQRQRLEFVRTHVKKMTTAQMAKALGVQRKAIYHYRAILERKGKSVYRPNKK